MSSRWRAVIVASAVLASGCGSSDADLATTETTSPAAETLTGTQICERLTIATVTADLGLDVAVATPDDTTTPQCVYEYVVGEGVTAELTVTAVRPGDVGGLSGQDAFDAVVAGSRERAGVDVEEQPIGAGDDAIRLTGSLYHIGVLDVNDRIYTLTVPTADAEPDGVDRLVASMATTLA